MVILIISVRTVFRYIYRKINCSICYVICEIRMLIYFLTISSISIGIRRPYIFTRSNPYLSSSFSLLSLVLSSCDSPSVAVSVAVSVALSVPVDEVVSSFLGATDVIVTESIE